MTPIQFLAGVIHELDPYSASAEIGAQGLGQAVFDSLGDLVANTLGMAAGLLLPPSLSEDVAQFLGSIVPGPDDPNPQGNQTNSMLFIDLFGDEIIYGGIIHGYPIYGNLKDKAFSCK